MTCIAWDGRMLAGDKQTTHEVPRGIRTRTRKVFRIRRPDGGAVLMGCAGDTGDCQFFVRWARNVATFGYTPIFSSLAVLSIDERRRVWMATERLRWERVRSPFWAIGSGADIALGALAAGRSAREAVLIANRFSSSCGFGVDVVGF